MASWRRQRRCSPRRRRLRCHLLFTSAAVGKWNPESQTQPKPTHWPPRLPLQRLLPLLSSSWQLHCLHCTSPVGETGRHCACPCLHYVHGSKTSPPALLCECVWEIGRSVCVRGCRKAKSLQLQLNLLLLLHMHTSNTMLLHVAAAAELRRPTADDRHEVHRKWEDEQESSRARA